MGAQVSSFSPDADYRYADSARTIHCYLAAMPHRLDYSTCNHKVFWCCAKWASPKEKEKEKEESKKVCILATG